jgi:ABC-2 type transport system ATP-binding protein
MDLVFSRVTKFYGPVIGVNEISCRVGAGITGLLGENGAGKSTMLKLASGQLRPSLGEVRLGEHSAWSTAAKRHLGYCPDIDKFYEEMTGREFVYAMVRLHGYSLREARDRTERALAEVGMTDRAHRRIAGCSHGMRQRIKLAQAIAHDPQLLLLDEPMNGIDPGGKRELCDLLVRYAARGKAILVSTHVLEDLETLADHILFIKRGRLIASGTVPEIREQLDDRPYTLQVAVRPLRKAAALLAELPEVQTLEVHEDHLIVQVRNASRFYEHLSALVLDHELEIERLITLDSTAGAVFGYLQQGAV